MLTAVVAAKPMMKRAIAVEVEAVETRLWEFRMSYRRILQDQGVFHKHHSRPRGSRLDKAKQLAWRPAELVLSSTQRLQLQWRLRLVA